MNPFSYLTWLFEGDATVSRSQGTDRTGPAAPLVGVPAAGLQTGPIIDYMNGAVPKVIKDDLGTAPFSSCA